MLKFPFKWWNLSTKIHIITPKKAVTFSHHKERRNLTQSKFAANKPFNDNKVGHGRFHQDKQPLLLLLQYHCGLGIRCRNCNVQYRDLTVLLHIPQEYNQLRNVVVIERKPIPEPLFHYKSHMKDQMWNRYKFSSDNFGFP
jgi:hypothetical protein